MANGNKISYEDIIRGYREELDRVNHDLILHKVLVDQLNKTLAELEVQPSESDVS